jgi:hypothetical protein
MKKLYLGGAAAAAILAAGSAFAQTAAAPAPAPQVHVMKTHRGPAKAVTRNEVVGHVRDMFARLDTNRDGVVTREEATAAHTRKAGETREKVAKRVAERGNRGAGFDRLDTNKDGSISRREFDAGRQARQQRRVLVMQQGGRPGMMRMHRFGAGFGRGQLFEMSDANKDGRVSLQEATAAALQHFDTADLNRDGTPTPEERMQMRQQRRAQRRPA